MSAAAIKSARRVFEVLEYFDDQRRPLSLKEICERHGYPPSSGAGILKSLVLLGYLEYDKQSRTYLPTMRIAALGGWVAADLFGGIDIIELMERLREETRETVILAAQSDIHAQYVHVLRSTQALNYAVSPGTLRPLAQSGFGRLLLSGRTDADIRVIVRRIDAARETGEAKIDVEALLAEVGAIRREGFLFSDSLITPGVGVIGILLPQTPFGRKFAIGLAGPAARIEAEKAMLLALLRVAEARFAEVVKARGPDPTPGADFQVSEKIIS
jgi:DNA-binding IclR family transcriptional regulator